MESCIPQKIRNRPRGAEFWKMERLPQRSSRILQTLRQGGGCPRRDYQDATGEHDDRGPRRKVLLADSGVTEDSPAALDYFQKSIQVPLLKKILDWDNVPETLPEWYKKALKVDNDYHKVQRIIKRDMPKKEEGKPRWNFRRDKDENAMDVDVITKVFKTMTDEERTELMRKGLCFRCKKGGHLSRDCPERKGKATTPQSTTPAPTPATPKKMTAKELMAHIRSLTALLNEEEKTEVYDEAEKEGF